MRLVSQLVVAVLIVNIARTNSIRKAPTVSLTPKNIRGVEKGMVYMLCNTTGIPRPNITLYKDGVKVTNSRIYKFKILHGWFIRIGPLKQRHQGTYRCEAANGVGPVVSDSSAILRVYQARATPSGFPRIGRSPRSQFKKSGEKVIFQCTVTGTPAPSIMWLQNKVPLGLSNRRFSVSANGDLTITNLEKADKGSYACVAENSKGMVISRDARLFVREVRRPPKFTVRPLGQTVNPDSDVYLNCSAVGFPKPAMVWELDGRRISGGGNGYLFISRIQRSGNYTCIADSFMGRVKAYAFVRVKLLPFAPTRPSATTITPNSITITWQSSGSHVVTSFVIEHKLKTEIQWKTSSIRGTMTLKISSLQPYSNYQFRVFAVNSLGKSGPSPVAEFKTSPSKPSSPPINITAKGMSDTSFRADWNPPLSPNGPIRGYRVYYSLDQKEAFSQWRFMASATNHATISGLTKQTTYFFKIAAYNIAGMGPASQVMAVKTHKGVPGQPHGVRLIVASSTSIHISWHEPQDLGDGIFGYEVYYNKSSKDMDTNVGASNGLNKNIMGLTPYTVYKFGVAAKSDKGIGPMSFAVTARTREDVPSGAPLNIVGKSKDSTTLEIKWDPPLPIHRNGIITDYTIKYKSKGGGRPKYMTVDGIKTSVVLHNLKKFTKYFVWVSASTKEGEGPMSSKHVFSTAEDVPSGAPTQLKAAVLNSSCIEVSWSPPTSAQKDGNILGYMVLYSKVDDLGNQLKPPAPVDMKDSESETNLKVYLINLAPETTYQIEVAGYTIKGDGARSVTKLAKTLPRLPDAPFVFTQKSPGNPSEITVGWRTSASDVMGYKVRYGKAVIRLRGRDLNKMKMDEKSLSNTKTTQTFQNLGRGLWYLFNVSLRTKAGWSPETAKWVQIPPGPPTGPPLNVRTKTSSPTNIKVTWSAPDPWKSGGGITKYIVLFHTVDNPNNISRKTVHGENHTKATLKRLLKYTAYKIQVKAVNSRGEGPVSADVYERTQEDNPGRPWNLVLKAQSSSVITVQWQEPRNPNGIIRKYKIIYTDNPSTDEKAWKSQEAGGTSASLRSLKRDVKYWVRVAAFTSVGIGENSKMATVKTLKFDLPGRCREFKFVQLDSDSIMIQWLPPAIDAGIITYKVSYSGSKSYKERGSTVPVTDAKDLSIPAVNNKQQSYKIQNLVPHMEYKLRISAINAMGDGPEVELKCKTKRDKPSSLTQPEVIDEDVNEGYIPVRLSKASERNGPVSYYLIVVVPLGKDTTLPKDEPDSYFKRVKRSRRSDQSQHAPYIAAKFMANQLPDRFHVGEESSSNQFGYINKRLTKGSYYTIFSRAYVEKENKELVYKSSPFTKPVSAVSPYSQSQTAAKKGATITLIIILVVVLVVIIAAVALGVACIVKRRNRRKDKKYKDEEKSEPSDPVELRRMNFQTPAMINHPPIPVGELPKHISYLKAENSSKFSHEFESIEPGQTFTTEASTAEINRPKNRYPNILAYDHTRVFLSSPDGYQDSDYINANFCDGYRKENAYIATQGPLPNTGADFWRMIWEQRTFTIVMLTREEERGRVKCDQYWPNEGTSTYDEIEVSLVDWVELANYTITTLQISMEGESQPREVKHFQFTGWPDHGVPPHPTPFLAFLRRVRFYNPPDAGPIVAHCSAGVGRTAIFIVIDSMLERIKHENSVDIYGHVTVLRTQRNFMVQTLEQYVFIHDALLEAVSAGNTEVHARNLLHHIKKLTELGKGEVTGLEEEFKKLIDPTQARRHKHGAATLPINRPKNRMANILPYESTRVHISPVRGVEGSDYINASFIDGYRQRGAFIATQGPLKDTVDDFWRMLMEQNSNIVVMMTKLHEGEWEKCYKYWPSERSARHQYYIVDPVSEQEFAQFVMRDFKVKDARNDTVRNIKQFHFTGWPETGVPKSGEGIIDLIGQVQRVYEQQEEDGPITVHCSDGVGRTGVFSSLFIVLERMRSEGVVDLFQTVKLLRTQRPAMVQSQEQYLFCYKTALEYLGSFDHYAT